MNRKRLYFTLGVLLIILIGAFALIFAVLDPSAAQDAALAPPTPTPVGILIPPSNDISRVTGTIQSLGNKSFIMALPHGNTTIAINVDLLTTYTLANTSVSFTNLKVGQIVYVQGRLDKRDPPQIMALSIVISS
jgi:hypothetical protein